MLGPVIAGLVVRWAGRPILLMTGSHYLVALMIICLVGGGPGGWLAGLCGLPVLPVWFDAALLFAFGLVLSYQIVVFSQVRAAVPPEQTGRALSANNVSFFGGAAVFQALSGVAAAYGGVGAALLTFAVGLLVCSSLYLWLRGRDQTPGGSQSGGGIRV